MGEESVKELEEKVKDIQLMPPPPPPSKQSSKLLSPSSAYTSRTTLFPSASSAQRVSSSKANPSRKKVVLEQGHSPINWAAFKKTVPKPQKLIRITPSELALHKDNLWMSIQGKIYDCGPYLNYHPGGKTQLKRGAGTDATGLFMKTHSWVNVDMMLDVFHVGYLIKGEDDVD